MQYKWDWLPACLNLLLFIVIAFRVCKVVVLFLMVLSSWLQSPQVLHSLTDLMFVGLNSDFHKTEKLLFQFRKVEEYSFPPKLRLNCVFAKTKLISYVSTGISKGLYRTDGRNTLQLCYECCCCIVCPPEGTPQLPSWQHMFGTPQ